MPSGSAARRSSCCASMKTIVLGPGENRQIEGHSAQVKISSEECDERFCVLETVTGTTIVFKAEAGDTGGAFGLVEYTAAPGFAGPPAHVHRETADMFFVLEGELAFRLGDETVAAPPGAFVLVAPGTVHTFSNPG